MNFPGESDDEYKSLREKVEDFAGSVAEYVSFSGVPYKVNINRIESRFLIIGLDPVPVQDKRWQGINMLFVVDQNGGVHASGAKGDSEQLLCYLMDNYQPISRQALMEMLGMSE